MTCQRFKPLYHHLSYKQCLPCSIQLSLLLKKLSLSVLLDLTELLLLLNGSITGHL